MRFKAIFWLPVTLLAVILGSAVYVMRDAGLPVPLIPAQDTCKVKLGDSEAELSLEQGRLTGLIAAIGVQRDLPARAVSIAIATAFQESKIRNLSGGDRDSLGIFQQRPSQGWGTEAEIQDPTYAINTFYDALVKIDGYTKMRITEAAQAVQRSGFPEAYEQHAAGSRALASALTGYSPAAFSCKVDTADAVGDEVTASGLTEQAQAVLDDLQEVFGAVSVGGFAPDGVASGHKSGSRHYEGKAVDIFFRPINPDTNRMGWAVASYLVSQADLLEIDTVIFDAKIWTSRRSSAGWRDYAPDTTGRSQASKDILLHRDHVHVDVA